MNLKSKFFIWGKFFNNKKLEIILITELATTCYHNFGDQLSDYLSTCKHITDTVRHITEGRGGFLQV